MGNDYKYVEFKNDYIRGENDIDKETEGLALEITSIDGWPKDPAEDGVVIANVFTTYHGDTFTNWHYPEYKDNPAAAACASEAEEKQKKDYAEYAKRTKIFEGWTERVVENRDGSNIAYRNDVYEKPGRNGKIAATILTSIHGDAVFDWMEEGHRQAPSVMKQLGDLHTKHLVAFMRETKLLKEKDSKKSQADDNRMEDPIAAKERSVLQVEDFMKKKEVNIHDVLKDMGYVGVKLIHEEDLRECFEEDEKINKMRKELHQAGVTDEEIIEKAIPHLKRLGEMHEEDYITMRNGLEEGMKTLAKELNLSAPAPIERSHSEPTRKENHLL